MNTQIITPRQPNGDEAFFVGSRKRRLSLEETFMDYKIDDILFGAMYYLATYHPEKRVFYLTKKNYVKNKTMIKELCGTTAQTVDNHLKNLIQAKLITEDTIKSGGIDCPAYTFTYEYKEKYQLVENEMLWYVVDTRSKQAVKIYTYLLNKYNWKKNENDYYIFTIKELLGALGYSTNSNNQTANNIITNILESFSREGVIRYETFHEPIITNEGKVVPAPKKRLLFVASSKKELPAVED